MDGRRHRAPTRPRPVVLAVTGCFTLTALTALTALGSPAVLVAPSALLLHPVSQHLPVAPAPGPVAVPSDGLVLVLVLMLMLMRWPSP